jgi:hypothetical protein
VGTKKCLTDDVTRAIISAVSLSGCTVGTDPEIFIVDKKEEIIPAFSFLPSKKEDKSKISDGSYVDRIFWDGFQAEFTLKANSCLAYLTDSLQHGLSLLLKKAKEADKDAHFTYKSVLDIPYSILNGCSPEHRELGCTPSHNAYGETDHLVGLDPSVLPFRFAGCHLHFGFQGTKETAENCVKAIDALCGIMSVALLQGMEDPRRRHYYGRAGEYRLPAHGLEYRTLSSAVLASPVLFHLCYDVARAALFLKLRSPAVRYIKGYKWETIANTINNYDVSKAKKIIKANESVFTAILTTKYGHVDKTKRILDMIYEGARNFFDIDDIDGNWRLSSSWNSHSGASNCCVANWTSGRKKATIKKTIGRIDDEEE